VGLAWNVERTIRQASGMGTLYYGDNLEILREHVRDEIVDRRVIY
jgi:hypothetical protein